MRRKRKKKRKSSKNLLQQQQPQSEVGTCTDDLHLLADDQMYKSSATTPTIMSMKSDAHSIEKNALDMNGQMKLNGIQNIIRVLPAKATAVSSTIDTKLGNKANTDVSEPMPFQANQKQNSLDDNSNHFLPSTTTLDNLIPPAVQEPTLPVIEYENQDSLPKPALKKLPEIIHENGQQNNNVDIRKQYSSEILLKPVSLLGTAMDSEDTGGGDLENSDTSSPVQPQNGGVYPKPPPRRSVSMPTKTRTDSTKTSDSESLSRWRSVKNAVRATNNIAKQNKSRKDSFMEK